MRSTSTVKSSSDAVVDAEDVGVDLERLLELALVVDLDERVEVERARLLEQHVEVGQVESGDDQQDRVGADRRGLVELVGVDDEVLAQDRQRRRPARLAQVVEAAAEVERLGQHRQRGGAAALVGADDVAHGRPGADLPGRRRAALVLGDQRDAGAQQRLGERPELGARGDRRLERGERDALPPAGDLLAGVVDDPLEHAHEATPGDSSTVRATSRSSALAAAPSSIAAWAAPTPSAIESTRPET